MLLIFFNKLYTVQVGLARIPKSIFSDFNALSLTDLPAEFLNQMAFLQTRQFKDKLVVSIYFRALLHGGARR